MKLLAVDGNSVFYRAFYGVHLLSTKDGIYTNAIFGFLNILLSEIDKVKPDGVAVAFDLPAPTFRHLEYAAYKAGRKPSPEELRMQMPLIQEILPLMGYTVVTKEGFEADDILGTISRLCEEDGGTCVILTGDRDSLQLISDKTVVSLASPKPGVPSTVFDKEKMAEEYGVSDPIQMIDIKALMGDASDNLPGVAGIGQKTAVSLISKYHSLDRIYDHLDEPELTKSVRTKLENGRESAYMTRRLATICREAPIETDMNRYAIRPMDRIPLAEKLNRLELASIMKRLGLDHTACGAAPAAKDSTREHQEIFISDDSFTELLREEAVLPLYDPETDILYIADGDSVFIAENGEETYQTLLRSHKIIATDEKELWRYCLSHGIEPAGISFGLTLASYLLKPESSDYSAEAICGRSFENNREKAVCLWDAAQIKMREVEEKGLGRILYEIELPLSRVLASMELLGIAVDRKGIEEYGVMLDNRLEEIQQKIYEEAGCVFNINSPKQLGQILFEQLKLPVIKKTKSGYSTNAEVLETLSSLHPVPSMIVEYRTLAKLKSTYVDALLTLQAEDGRIHSRFIQTVTRTGRISSADPNLQNIPVRSQLGGELRRFFVAKEGCKFIDADYSQIELRVLAHMSNDNVMQQAFRENADIHTKTASEMFHLPVELVTPAMRSRAKAINFGIVYGMGAFSLAKDTGVTLAEASGYIKDYFDTYKNIKSFLDTTVADAHETGMVKTLFGRIRYIPEIKNKNKSLAAIGERMAKNTPIQGTAADIIKIAMIRVYDRLRREKPEAKLILQIHDELLVEAPEQEVEAVSAILREEMENAVSLSVPLLTDLHVGENWLEAKQ